MEVQKTQRATKVETDDIFTKGKYAVAAKNINKSDTSSPPTELFIISPVEEGKYPVTIFCHGFMLPNTWYTTLLTHIATHGYIFVAPKFYGLIPISVANEITQAANVTEWLSKGLPQVLPQKVIPDANNLVLLGHSRGGKTAFALEEKYEKLDKNHPKFKALIGINPVEGFNKYLNPEPHILQFIPRSLDISIPVAVIGCGLENQSLCLIPPFGPDGYNHSEFFNESKPPCAYFLANGYGHCDVMDDGKAVLLSYICKSVLNDPLSNRGPAGLRDLDLLRRSVGGIVVAFLKCHLDGKPTELDDIVNNPSIAPATMKPVIYVKH